MMLERTQKIMSSYAEYCKWDTVNTVKDCRSQKAAR